MEARQAELLLTFCPQRASCLPKRPVLKSLLFMSGPREAPERGPLAYQTRQSQSPRSHLSLEAQPPPHPTLSGRRSSKSFKSSGLGNKPLTIDPATVLSVQSKELDNTQLLMLLTRRDLLMPPVFLTTDEQEAPPPLPVVSSEKDSQSSDDESSPTLSESSQSDLTGLLSLLRVQPKPKPFSGLFATPMRA